MPRYNFTSLSHQDFEELSRDLLQAEWNVALESFKSGRDEGIDLRYAPLGGGTTIVQCKHYAGSGFNKLLSHLRDIERSKIERLSPHRYVVITSIGLTPGNKDAICDALKPFVLTVSDIMGAGEIEGLLSRHPAVERANFKLWLTSTEVIERVLHNAEICNTEFQVERICQKLPLFVQSGAFPRAMQLLEDSRIVVISGAPGIGKTTLADILLYAHLEQGYEPVVIQSEIAEGRRFYKKGTKQIFYYDDFLGQTFLRDRSEYLGQNQDSALIDFMEMVKRSKYGRFLLTTREHILSLALQTSERFVHSLMLRHKCVLELRDYTFGDKSRILYNHLYFSSLAQPYKEAVLQDAFFLKIIKHEHFNPRLIEWLSTQARLRDVSSDTYRAHISGLLDSPEKIWNHAFRNQISDAARSVLLSFYTLGAWVDSVDLEPAFLSLHRYSADKYHRKLTPGDFRDALQELDGAFLTYSSGHVSFLNPSVRDFVAAVIYDEPEIAKDLLAAAVRMKQIFRLWQLSEAQPQSALRSILMTECDFVYASLSRTSLGPSMRWVKQADGSQRGSHIDLEDAGKISFVMKVATVHRSARLAALSWELAGVMISPWGHYAPNFPSVISLLDEIGSNKWILQNGGQTVYRMLLDQILDEDRIICASGADWLELLGFPEKAWNWSEEDETALAAALERYVESGVSDDRHNCSSPEEMTELIEALQKLETQYGLDFKSDISLLEDDIAEHEERRERYEGGGGAPSAREAPPRDFLTDDDVIQMFSTLSGGDT